MQNYHWIPGKDSYWNRRLIPNMSDFEDIIYAIRYEQRKADAPMTTQTIGLSNTQFGLEIWNQINYDKRPFAILPSTVFRSTGFNVKTGKAIVTTTNGNTALGGIGELGKLPETTHGTYAKIKVDPKIIGLTASESLKKELLSEIDDDTIGGMAFVRQELGYDYSEIMTELLMQDQETRAKAATGNYSYYDDEEIVPYDKAISSNPEENALGGDHDGQYDLYGTQDGGTGGMDRDSNSVFNSTVITCNESKDIGGTNGVIDKTHFSDLIAKIRTASGKEPTFFLMPYEMQAEIMHLYDGDVFYTPSNTVSAGVNGVQDKTGLGVQYNVAAIEGIPLIGSKYSVKNTADAQQAGKIFAVCTDGGPRGHVMELSVLYPTVETSSMYGYANSQHDLVNRVGLITIFETIIHQPNACGKIIDCRRRN